MVRAPADWPCDGTTGYDFLNAVNGLFVDGSNEQAMTDAYAEFVGAEAHQTAVLLHRDRPVAGRWALAHFLVRARGGVGRFQQHLVIAAKIERILRQSAQFCSSVHPPFECGKLWRRIFQNRR